LVNPIKGLGEAGKAIITATHELDIIPVIARRVMVIGEDRRIVADGTRRRDPSASLERTTCWFTRT